MADEETQMQTKHVVKHPGGVILHLKGGSSEHFAYGREVEPDALTDHQRERLHLFTDDKDRSAYTVEQETNRQANRNAIFADGGQPNSTSDPVPGNYDSLTEDEAAQLMLALSNEPHVQARLVLHERVHCGSRQSVVDAATDEAKQTAELLYEDLQSGAARFPNTPAPDHERQVEREVNQSAKSARSHRSGGGSKGTPPPSE